MFLKFPPGCIPFFSTGGRSKCVWKCLLTDWLLHTGGREYSVDIVDPRSWRRSRGGKIDLAGRQQVSAPMAGKIVRVLIAQGQHVESGQGLLVVEAMKMQNEIRLAKNGDGRAARRQGRRNREPPEKFSR